MTLAMNAFSTGMKPIAGSTVPRRARMKIAATPARAPEIANAVAITRFAGIPISRVTWKSWRGREHPEPLRRAAQEEGQHPERAKQVTVVIICSQPIVNGADRDRLVEDVRERHALLPRRYRSEEEVLDDHADREAREQQRDEARSAQRPKRDALHQHSRDDRRRDRRGTWSQNGMPVAIHEVDRVRRRS